MTAIAVSMDDSWYQWWTSRIGAWKRHPETDSPTESVWYETFKGTGSAALAWRQRDPRVVPLGADSSSRPEVSRVYMGPAEVLTPRRAIALCAAGLGALGKEAGPLPGTFMPGSVKLPEITEAQLARLTTSEKVDQLDRAAAEQTGLDLLIAAALGERDKPLAVELPGQYIAQPLRDGPQARLLWGLSRTLEPLLGQSFGGQRTWSFSTFEPPLGATDPDALGTVVFRTMQSGQATAPMAFRHERVIRPYQPDQSAASAWARTTQMAKWLVRAYRSELSALEQQLEECARGIQQPRQRVEAAYQMLARRFGEQVPASRPESVTLSAGSRSDDQEPAGSRSAALAAAPDDRTPQPAQASTRLTQVVAGLADDPARWTIDSVLAVLSDPGARYAIDDRAETRDLLRERDWYVGSLGQDPRFHDLLATIFTKAVSPDLDPPRAERQLEEWAAYGGAPEQVIRLLYRACALEETELTAIMGPAFGTRWLAEKRISTGPPRPMQLRSAQGQLPPNRGPVGQAPHGRRVSAPLPSVPPGQRFSGPLPSVPPGAVRGQDGPAHAGHRAGASPVPGKFAPDGKPGPVSRQRLLATLRLPVPLYTALALALAVLILMLVS